MSREEYVFSKRAIVAVSAISVIGSNIVIGFLAAMWLWRFSDQLQQKTTEAATIAAVAATEASIRPIREVQIEHRVIIDQIQVKQSKFEDQLERIRVNR